MLQNLKLLLDLTCNFFYCILSFRVFFWLAIFDFLVFEKFSVDIFLLENSKRQKFVLDLKIDNFFGELIHLNFLNFNFDFAFRFFEFLLQNFRSFFSVKDFCQVFFVNIADGPLLFVGVAGEGLFFLVDELLVAPLFGVDGLADSFEKFHL